MSSAALSSAALGTSLGSVVSDFEFWIRPMTASGDTDLDNGLQADDETLDEFWRELGLALKRGTPSDVFPLGELLDDPAQPTDSPDAAVPPAQRMTKQNSSNTTGRSPDDGSGIRPALFEDQPVTGDNQVYAGVTRKSREKQRPPKPLAS